METLDEFIVPVDDFSNVVFDNRTLHSGGGASAAVITFVAALGDFFFARSDRFRGFLRYTKSGSTEVDRRLRLFFDQFECQKTQNMSPDNYGHFTRMAKVLNIPIERMIVVDADWWRALAAYNAGVGLVIMPAGMPSDEIALGRGSRIQDRRRPLWEAFQTSKLPGTGKIVVVSNFGQLRVPQG